LFIGASVISVFEIIDFIVILVRVVFSKTKRARTNKSSVVQVQPYITDDKRLGN